MEWAYYLLLLVVAIFGLFVTIFGLPGLWLVVAGLAGYAWLTGFDVYVGWPSLITLLSLAVAAEIVEFVAGSAGAAKAGASKRAMIGAILGALIGGVVFSIPIPIVGTILGVCLGAFIGAAVVELFVRRDVGQSMRVGTGAAKGRFLGIVTKLFFGVVMLIVLAIAALPIGDAPTPAAPPLDTPGNFGFVTRSELRYAACR